MLEREWTEKEPVVSEWPHEKDTRKDPLNAEQPPKLSMKLLYGMIQELQQYNERIAARLDEFEIYLIQVQAARAQLEASAASTIAKAKEVAALHERMNAANIDAAVNGNDAAGAAAAEASENDHAAAKTAAESKNEPAAVFHDAAPDREQAVAASADTESPAAVAADLPIVPAAIAEPQVGSSLDAPAAAIAAEVAADGLEHASPSPISSAIIDTAPASDIQMDVYMKPLSRESGSDALMTLAMEVMGLTSDEQDDEDGLDAGEGVNPFDPDSFAADAYAYAAADASPELPAQTGSPGSGLTSPFFTPRSQRHQGAKKKFLNLFGFRTRIS